MSEMSDVSRRVRAGIEQARRDAADRRVRLERDGARARAFLESTATPVLRQFASVLKAEGFLFRLSTPAGAVRLVSESRHEDFIDLAVDATQDPVTIVTTVSHIRGKRVDTAEQPLRPGVEIDRLTDEDVLEFLIGTLPIFVAR
ncbi:MAG: hypothetical protein O3A25_00305 [Acidobacteria bacterium]|nr:hypothetical protein [Acidobacteriota bacterium]